ncbi:MAG TPA: hypothetical protein VD735_04395 [Candidatus Saccharimonadales bacterium]|nr:hypothetical protein [Candidatus Saccharimonadales bacterium]
MSSISTAICTVRNLLLAGALCAVLYPTVPGAQAVGPTQFPIDVETSGKSAEADGNDYILFSLYIYGWYCVTTQEVQESNVCPDGSRSTSKVGRPNHNIAIYASGSDNIFTDTKTSGMNRYVTADDNGEAQFMLSSTKAETKTLRFTDNLWGTPYEGATGTAVAFNGGSGEASPDAAATLEEQAETDGEQTGDGAAATGSSPDDTATDTKTAAKDTSDAKETASRSSLLVGGAIVAGLMVLACIAWLIISKRRSGGVPSAVTTAVATHNPVYQQQLGRIAVQATVERPF